MFYFVNLFDMIHVGTLYGRTWCVWVWRRVRNSRKPWKVRVEEEISLSLFCMIGGAWLTPQ